MSGLLSGCAAGQGVRDVLSCGQEMRALRAAAAALGGGRPLPHSYVGAAQQGDAATLQQQARSSWVYVMP